MEQVFALEETGLEQIAQERSTIRLLLEQLREQKTVEAFVVEFRTKLSPQIKQERSWSPAQRTLLLPSGMNDA